MHCKPLILREMLFRLSILLLTCHLVLSGCVSTHHSPQVFVEAKQYQGEGVYLFFVPDTLQKAVDQPPENPRLIYMHLINGTNQTLLIEDVAGMNSPSISVSAKPADGSDGHGYVSPCIRVGQLQFQEYRPLQITEVKRFIKMRWKMHEHQVEHRTYQYQSKAIPIRVPDWSIPMIVSIDDSLRTYATDPAAHVFIPVETEVVVEPKQKNSRNTE